MQLRMDSVRDVVVQVVNVTGVRSRGGLHASRTLTLQAESGTRINTSRRSALRVVRASGVSHDPLVLASDAPPYCGDRMPSPTCDALASIHPTEIDFVKQSANESPVFYWRVSVRSGRKPVETYFCLPSPRLLASPWAAKVSSTCKTPTFHQRTHAEEGSTSLHTGRRIQSHPARVRGSPGLYWRCGCNAFQTTSRVLIWIVS